MTTSLEDAIMAIHGSGAGSRFALQVGSERHEVELGPLNATTDFEAATQVVLQGIECLASAAQYQRNALTRVPAYIAVAGVVDDPLARQVQEALPLDRAQIEDDRHATVRGALNVRNGALAWLGTGSYFAMQSEGTVRLAGGWGAALGDTGSSYWIGHEALVRVLDVVDGLMEPSDLTREITARFNERPGEIVAFSQGADPQDFAALAPDVVAAAASGDPVACGILKSGAYYIEDTLRRMGWKAGQRLCLLGGASKAYAPFLPLDMEGSIVEPLGTPLDGALDLARALAELPTKG
ncbi:MAG: BadF/BadG/BcrA/BcrD ATPase family protein [Pseudomonadota bacterium]